MNQIIISTKFIPKMSLKYYEKRLEFFKQMRRIGYKFLHFDFNRFEMNELLDEKWMMRLFDDISNSDIKILNSHLYVNPLENIWDNNGYEKEMKIWRVLEQCLKYNKILDIGNTVYHVPELRYLDISKCQRFISKVPRLLDLSAKYNNCICLENHYNAKIDNFILSYLFHRFDKDVLRMTFDTGHYLLSRNEKIIESDFFERLSLVHLHDNDREKDIHKIPDITNNAYLWNRIFAQIKKNPAKPPLIFEIEQDVMTHSMNYIGSLQWMYMQLCNIIDYYNLINN